MLSRLIVVKINKSISINRFLSTIKFTKSHEYIQLNGNIGTVGISQHAASTLGDVVYVDLPAVGSKFDAGNVIGHSTILFFCLLFI